MPVLGYWHLLFQSSPPLWGVTAYRIPFAVWDNIFQSSRPVWGTMMAHNHRKHGIDISIYVPRVGHDSCGARMKGADDDFNPRARVGHDQEQKDDPTPIAAISIHVPRVGHDLCIYQFIRWQATPFGSASVSTVTQ